jgi:hypothetical protein
MELFNSRLKSRVVQMFKMGKPWEYIERQTKLDYVTQLFDKLCFWKSCFICVRTAMK